MTICFFFVRVVFCCLLTGLFFLVDAVGAEVVEAEVVEEVVAAEAGGEVSAAAGVEVATEAEAAADTVGGTFFFTCVGFLGDDCAGFVFCIRSKKTILKNKNKIYILCFLPFSDTFWNCSSSWETSARIREQ